MPPAAQRVPRGANRRGHRPSGRVSKRVPLAYCAAETWRRRLRSTGAAEIAGGYRRAEPSASDRRIAREIARRTRRKSSGPLVRAAPHSSAAHLAPAHVSRRRRRPAARAAVRMPAPAEARVPPSGEVAASVRASSMRAPSVGASAPVRAFAVPSGRRLRH